MPALINSYLHCQLVDIGAGEGRHGPFIITQAGFDPEDLYMSESVFYLRRDGLWIDEIAQISRPDEERMLILYEDAEEAAKALKFLGGTPLIVRYPLSKSAIQTRIVELRCGATYVERFGRLAALFREARRAERV
jgi:hypothetical protein